ncbi:hypothetical protein MPNT_90012 [Candidatus Methylacidithermus pantelleriae]|uniref:Uncharacterized protein n=1 Tax=Candidatus Methylacidithermus pantelleriae TaxID=2744239 RepID=A0A8J2FTY3_9BACT|nr:hypothetical protein MPNT_90012 [Candidatus Methylacidithermus pantelleriae]
MAVDLGNMMLLATVFEDERAFLSFSRPMQAIRRYR